MRHVVKKGTVLIGFHERKSRYLADMQVCPVLPKQVSEMLMPLRALIGSMDARETCPQIELACGDVSGGVGLGVIALVLRHLEPLSGADIDRLKAFASQHPGVQWWLQSKGPETVKLLEECGTPLAYELPAFGVTMPFKPTDFTQVNPHINRSLVSRALRLLGRAARRARDRLVLRLGQLHAAPGEPGARGAGIEGSDALVARATANFKRNRPATPARRALSATKFGSTRPFRNDARDAGGGWLRRQMAGRPSA